MEENPPRLPRLAGAPVEENQTGGFLGLDIGLLVIGAVVFYLIDLLLWYVRASGDFSSKLNFASHL